MRYFNLRELTFSITAKNRGIDNTPDEQTQQNLIALIENVLDPIRDGYGRPVIVTSGYRCERLNKLVKGAANSSHLTGCAADIRSSSDSFKDNMALYKAIRRTPMVFDQIIYEFGTDEGPDWIHVSYNPQGHNRREVLRARKKGSRTIYTREV